MARRVVVSLVLIVILLSGGLAGRAILLATKPEPPRHATQTPPLVVDTVKLAPQTVTEKIVGYGTARADRLAWITAQVAGEIVEVADALQEGEPVATGDILLRIDPRQYERQRDKAMAQLAADDAQLERIAVELENTRRLLAIAETEREIAEREYQRVLALFEAQQTTRREVDLARQAFEAARRNTQSLENTLAVLPKQQSAAEAQRKEHRADLALAELQLERCVLRAPFDGRIDAVSVEFGERVAPGQRLFAVLDPVRIEVPLELPLSVAGRIRVGAGCELSLESDPSQRWRGGIARVAPSADAMNRTIAAYVEIDNDAQEQSLLPGTFVRALVDGAVLHDVMLVPRGSVLSGHVFVYENGTARRTPVRTVRQLFDDSVIEGVSAGAVIITSNLDALFDGRAVSARGASAPNEPPLKIAGDGVDAASDAADGGASEPTPGS